MGHTNGQMGHINNRDTSNVFFFVYRDLLKSDIIFVTGILLHQVIIDYVTCSTEVIGAS